MQDPGWPHWQEKVGQDSHCPYPRHLSCWEGETKLPSCSQLLSGEAVLLCGPRDGLHTGSLCGRSSLWWNRRLFPPVYEAVCVFFFQIIINPNYVQISIQGVAKPGKTLLQGGFRCLQGREHMCECTCGCVLLVEGSTGGICAAGRAAGQVLGLLWACVCASAVWKALLVCNSSFSCCKLCSPALGESKSCFWLPLGHHWTAPVASEVFHCGAQSGALWSAFGERGTWVTQPQHPWRVAGLGKAPACARQLVGLEYAHPKETLNTPGEWGGLDFTRLANYISVTPDQNSYYQLEIINLTSFIWLYNIP